MRCRYGALGVFAVLLALAGSAPAQTWDGGGANDNWSNNVNWLGDIGPANNGTANIAMAGVTRLTPNVDVPFDINALTFNSGASAFVIGGSQLTLRGGI